MLCQILQDQSNFQNPLVIIGFKVCLPDWCRQRRWISGIWSLVSYFYRGPLDIQFVQEEFLTSGCLIGMGLLWMENDFVIKL